MYYRIAVIIGLGAVVSGCQVMAPERIVPLAYTASDYADVDHATAYAQKTISKLRNISAWHSGTQDIVSYGTYAASTVAGGLVVTQAPNTALRAPIIGMLALSGLDNVAGPRSKRQAIDEAIAGVMCLEQTAMVMDGLPGGFAPSGNNTTTQAVQHGPVPLALQAIQTIQTPVMHQSAGGNGVESNAFFDPHVAPNALREYAATLASQATKHGPADSSAMTSSAIGAGTLTAAAASQAAADEAAQTAAIAAKANAPTFLVYQTAGLAQILISNLHSSDQSPSVIQKFAQQESANALNNFNSAISNAVTQTAQANTTTQTVAAMTGTGTVTSPVHAPAGAQIGDATPPAPNGQTPPPPPKNAAPDQTVSSSNSGNAAAATASLQARQSVLSILQMLSQSQQNCQSGFGH